MILVMLLLALAGCSKGSAPSSGSAAQSSQSQPAAEARPAAKSAPGGAADPMVRITGAKGRAGASISIDAVLEHGANNLAAISTDLRYDAKRLRVETDAQGKPACVAGDAVGPASPVKKQIFARERVEEGSAAILRVALLGPDNANPMPDGKIFSCTFRIAADAGGGAIALSAQSQAASVKAEPVSVQGSEGSVALN